MAMNLDEIAKILQESDFKFKKMGDTLSLTFELDNQIMVAIGSYHNGDVVVLNFVPLYSGKYLDTTICKDKKSLAYELINLNLDYSFGDWEFGNSENCLSFAIKIPLLDNVLTSVQLASILNFGCKIANKDIMKILNFINNTEPKTDVKISESEKSLLEEFMRFKKSQE